MITNKRLGLHLLPLLVLVLLGPGCSIFKKPPEPPVEQSTPPPTVEKEPEPVEPVVSAAEAPPPVPTATPIRAGVPERYTVKKGDTLWDIAKHFLNDPWLWPEVWNINQAIRNPHLIYPGDVIALTWVNGRPVLTLEGAEAAPPPPPRPDLRTVKLTPEARVESIRKSITTLPKNVIAPFLYRPFFISENQLKNAAFIIANYGDHSISGTGERVYARGIEDGSAVNFNVVRKGVVYKDPETGKVLGYEAINLGEATLVKLGDPVTLTITKAYKEILKGDFLLPRETEQVELNFFPRAPGKDIAGRVISVADGVAKIGQYNVIVINKGTNEGLEPGHVLEIHQEGAIVRQPYSRARIKLPEERAGLAMVFKPYDTVSYALVMEAFKELKVYDYVYSP